MKIDHLAMGLGLAVLAFVGYQTIRRPSAATTNAAPSPNGGALWQTLTLPLGARGANGGNVLGTFDQVYSSASWNPDALSSELAMYGGQALAGAGISTANVYGFTMPTGG